MEPLATDDFLSNPFVELSELRLLSAESQVRFRPRRGRYGRGERRHAGRNPPF